MNIGGDTPRRYWSVVGIRPSQLNRAAVSTMNGRSTQTPAVTAENLLSRREKAPISRTKEHLRFDPMDCE